MESNLAIERLEAFAADGLTQTLGEIQWTITGRGAGGVEKELDARGISLETFSAALTVKRLSAEINVVVHAIGMLVVLPKILQESETIDYASLGAGGGGGPFDLETNLRIAEFKFIEWKGNDSVRQDTLFHDIYKLAEFETEKRRQVYLLGLNIPSRFLTGGRAIRSVFSKHAPLLQQFELKHGNRIGTVREYWRLVDGRIDLIDMRPLLRGQAQGTEED